MVNIEENRLSATLNQINTMVKVNEVKDKQALEVLLRTGRAFNPMEGFVAAVYPARQGQEEAGKSASTSEELFSEQAEGWERRVSHGGKGEPYDFMPYAKVSGKYVDILSECRQKGFGRGVDEPDGYSYRIIAGGLMRRRINVSASSNSPQEREKKKAPPKKRQGQSKTSSLRRKGRGKKAPTQATM